MNQKETQRLWTVKFSENGRSYTTYHKSENLADSLIQSLKERGVNSAFKSRLPDQSNPQRHKPQQLSLMYHRG